MKTFSLVLKERNLCKKVLTLFNIVVFLLEKANPWGFSDYNCCYLIEKGVQVQNI